MPGPSALLWIICLRLVREVLGKVVGVWRVGFYVWRVREEGTRVVVVEGVKG